MNPIRPFKFAAMVVLCGSLCGIQVRHMLAQNARGPGEIGAAKHEESSRSALTCADISIWIRGILESGAGAKNARPRDTAGKISDQIFRAGALRCDAMPSLPYQTPLQLSQVSFDHAIQSWDFFLRCAHPGDCIPFMVRWPVKSEPDARSPQSPAAQPLPANSRSSATIAPPHSLREAQSYLLRPGAAVTVLWDQDGIRMIVPAVSVDRGNLGDPVRVRTKSGRLLRAQIVSESVVRPIL